MISRKVKLAFVGGLDLIYINKPYPLSHTGLQSRSQKENQPHTPTTHGQKMLLFFSVERQFLKKLWFNVHRVMKLVVVAKILQEALRPLAPSLDERQKVKLKFLITGCLVICMQKQKFYRL